MPACACQRISGIFGCQTHWSAATTHTAWRRCHNWIVLGFFSVDLIHAYFHIHLDCQSNDDHTLALRVSPLFEYGFFEIRMRMEIRSIKFIKANCMTCQRMGRQNLIQAPEDQISNLVSHLKVNQSAKWIMKKKIRYWQIHSWCRQKLVIFSECIQQNMNSIYRWRCHKHRNPPHNHHTRISIFNSRSCRQSKVNIFAVWLFPIFGQWNLDATIRYKTNSSD